MSRVIGRPAMGWVPDEKSSKRSLSCTSYFGLVPTICLRSRLG